MAATKQSALDMEIDEIIAGGELSTAKKPVSWLRTIRDSFSAGKSGCGSCVKCGLRRSVKDDGHG